jgi:hypothetical protein
MKYGGPKPSRFAMVAAMLVAASTGCSFVEMGPGADAVRVVAPGQLPAGCVKRGEVEVSVKDRLGPYSRDELRVKDELEVLARNEAPGLDADTIQAKAPPADGEQRFLAFRCGTASAVAPPPVVDEVPPPDPDSAKTQPLKDE